MTTRISNEKFTFIEFEAIPEANLLIKKSREKRVEPKVMSLLIYLASRSGSVVTRGEILEELWPNVVVGDEVISQLIYSLRNALTDDAKKPRYIETIPKKGYRFIAEVNIIENELDMSEMDASIDKDLNTITDQKTNQPNLNNKWLPIIGFSVFLVFVLTWLFSSLFLQKNLNNLSIKNILPITQDVGVESSFNFHKNHNKMLYIHYQNQQSDIFLKTIGNNESQQLTNDKWVESSPIWLDEKTILYIRKNSDQYQIIRQPLTKSIEVIYESTKSIFNLVIKKNEPFSVSFIEYDNYQHNKVNELKSLNLTSKKITYLHDSVLHLPSYIRHHVYDEKGLNLYFFDNSNKVKEIVSLDIQSNQYTTLTKQFSWVEHIAVLDSESLLISGELSATKGIWQLNLIDHSIKSVLPSSSGQRITRALYKQDKIYYSTYKASSNLVIADIKQQKLDFLPKLNSDADEYYGIYSKNHDTIYFISNRTGYYEIWSYNIDNQQTKQVSQLQANYIHKPVISHTEDYFAVVYEKEALTLSIISLATGKSINERKIPSMKYPLAWSKDDKSIYISEHNKHVNIYQYNLDTLQPKLIQLRAGLFAQENTDDETLTLIDYKLGGLISKSVANGKATHLNSSIANLDSLLPGELKTVGQSVFAVKKDGSIRKIYKYSLDNKGQKSPNKLLMDLPNWSRVTDFNANGTKAIFFSASPPEGDIMAIQLESNK